jgi:hypothetical protein
MQLIKTILPENSFSKKSFSKIEYPAADPFVSREDISPVKKIKNETHILHDLPLQCFVYC